MPCIQFALAHKYGLWPSLCLKKQLLNTVWLCLETRINKLRKHMDTVKKARQYDFDLSWIHTFRRVLLLSRTSDISEPCQWWQGTTIWNNTMHKNQNQHSSSALTVWYAIYKYYHQRLTKLSSRCDLEIYQKIGIWKQICEEISLRIKIYQKTIAKENLVKKISETGQQHNTRSTSLHASLVFLPNAIHDKSNLRI